MRIENLKANKKSSRAKSHEEAIDLLWDAGFLYACDCAQDQVKERTKGNPTPGYDGYCRDRHVVRSDLTALRFRVSDEGATVVHDIIRGDVEFMNNSYEDFIVVRSNGVDDRSWLLPGFRLADGATAAPPWFRRPVRIRLPDSAQTRCKTARGSGRTIAGLHRPACMG